MSQANAGSTPTYQKITSSRTEKSKVNALDERSQKSKRTLSAFSVHLETATLLQYYLIQQTGGCSDHEPQNIRWKMPLRCRTRGSLKLHNLNHNRH